MNHGKRIAFFGTPPFTTRFLDTLLKEGYAPSLIVTNPDRPYGRGMQLRSPEPKLWGDAHGIRVLQPEQVDDAFMSELSKEPWDLFVVVAYGHILPESLITLPVHGTINVHYSLLPAYRGATPVESAILSDDEATGVCVQQMRFALDLGPILASREVPISLRDTTETLREKLNDEALEMLPRTLTSLLEGSASWTEQDEHLATYCKKIKKGDGKLTLSDDPLVNDRKFRAYTSSPGTFFIAQKNGSDIRVKIKSAHLEDGRFVLDIVIPENGKPMDGEVFARWVNA